MDMEPVSSLKPAGSGNLAAGPQTHGALLTRYHSAPSAVFDALLHTPDAPSQISSLPLHNSERAHLCKPSPLLTARNGVDDASQGHISAFQSNAAASSLTGTRSPQVAMTMTAGFPQQCINFHGSPTSGHLSSIFKPTQNCQTSIQNDNRTSAQFLSKIDMPESLSSVCQPFLTAKTSNLVRHSSFPAEMLSGIGEEESNVPHMRQFPGFYAPLNNLGATDMHKAVERTSFDMMRSAAIASQTMVTANVVNDVHVSHINTLSAQSPARSTGWPNCNGKLTKGSNFNGKSTLLQAKEMTKFTGVESLGGEPPLSATHTGLFRQSSLPASLLSRLSFDGASEGISSCGNSSDEEKRVAGVQYSSQISGFWDDAGAAEVVALGQKKRGREVEGKVADRSSALDANKSQGCSTEEEILQWNFGDVAVDTSLRNFLRLDDSVLCRARAKRGCATHPRSIAERVRRTKISEAMRKLQELVPNMEKQTSTATMLDEAAEYVKSLQQQVQKLSESQSKCNGKCRSKGST